jgi:uncharacterized protein
LELGKVAVGAATETKNTLEVVYIKVEEDGKKLLEVDKLNFVCEIDGEDIVGSIRNLI